MSALERHLERVVIKGVVVWFKARRRYALSSGWVADRARVTRDAIRLGRRA